jgi:hypothetical protein
MSFDKKALAKYKSAKRFIIFYKNKVYTIFRSTRYPITNYKQKFFYKGKYMKTWKAPLNHPTEYTYETYKFYLLANNYEDLKQKIIQYYIKKK